MKRVVLIVFTLLVLFSTASAQRRAITVDDLWSMKRVGPFSLSPDGEWIAFTVTHYDNNLENENSDIYLVNSMGGSARQLTTHPGTDSNPCWSPDGSLLAFISMRGGNRQIYVIPMDGGEAQRVSDISTGVDDFVWSPNGQYFTFTSRVKTPQRDSTVITNGSKVEARIINKLRYRYDDKWIENRKSHLFVMHATGGKPWNVTPGDYDTPPLSLGSHQDFTFSPNGQEIAFVRNTDSQIALSTNNDIFVVPSEGGTIRRITQNPGNDNQPVYSPDGRYIAYREMRRPGYEADQYDLIIYNRASRTTRNLTQDFDLDVHEIIWAPSSETIYFSSGDQGRIVIFSVEIKNGKIKGLVHNGCNSNLFISPDENRLFFLKTQINLPHQIFSSDNKGEKLYQLTFTNTNLLEQLDMNAIEEFWFPSFDGNLIHGFLLKHPFFDPAKKYPCILLIHDGPQDAWQDEFHYHWNAQLFASRGYIVIMINPRGSKGYGQTFCTAVSKNWGGAPYRDLMSGIDYVVKNYGFIDPERLAVAGAGYGGYLINWLAGHTDRFSCMISHAGIFNPVSYYGTTEELWSPEFEFDGTPFENTRQYDRWSPYRHANNFKTPTLVIHGEKDFRFPVEQGLQMFTALQRQNVPSKLLYFPDEGHFIKRAKNAKLWWQTVLDWMDEWTK